MSAGLLVRWDNRGFRCSVGGVKTTFCFGHVYSLNGDFARRDLCTGTNKGNEFGGGTRTHKVHKGCGQVGGTTGTEVFWQYSVPSGRVTWSTCRNWWLAHDVPWWTCCGLKSSLLCTNFPQDRSVNCNKASFVTFCGPLTCMFPKNNNYGFALTWCPMSALRVHLNEVRRVQNKFVC